MELKNILDASWVVPNLAATRKAPALDELARTLCSRCQEVPVSHEAVLAALMEREAMGSTGVGDGVAIPHAKIVGLPRLVACFGRAIGAVDFDAIDQQPVRLIFVLLIPQSSEGSHLKALARISRLLKRPALRSRLLAEPGPGLHPILVEEDGRP